ncbi:MAG: TetR family transcriptional regulator [Nitrospinaceae bacterium]|nr:MAG: TetR family transcriptional regulator [Nitrospinaceae bacterium]
MTLSSKREHLIETAVKLFSRRGFHAVGIDMILKESGVAKRTLYNHFKSKDELILAVLRYYDERFRNFFMRAVESHAEKPRDRLLAVFDVAENWFRQDDFYGCLYVGAAGEYPEKGTPIRNTCRDFKGLILDYIKIQARAAKVEKPDLLAEQLLLLLEGAITMAQINGSPVSAKQAKDAAKVLIENATITS